MNIKRNCFLNNIIAVFILITLNPYYVWGQEREFFVLSFSLVLVTTFLSSYRFHFFSKQKLIFSFLLFVSVFIYYRLVGASPYGAFLFALWLAYLFSIKNKVIVSIFDKFKFFYAVILTPGIALWVIHLLFNNYTFYLGPIAENIIPNQIKVSVGQGYALFPFAVVADYMLADIPYRLHGPFDEPGFVGTISALILAANRFRFKKKSDYIILASGLLSLSFAFYVLMFFYGFIVSMFNYKMMGYFVLSLFVVFIVAQFNSKIYDYTFGRVQVSEGSISGNNRTDTEFEKYFNEWKTGGESVLMLGLDDFSESASSSWKLILVNAGFIGLFLFSLILFIYILSFRYPISLDVYFIAFIFIFILSIYQRPDVLMPGYILVFCRGILKDFSFNKKRELLHDS